MKRFGKQSGLSLIEATLVVASAALLTALALPTARSFINSLTTESGVKATISSALASARAIAAKEQRYAGIRFQYAYHPEGQFKANQYIVFIVQDSRLGAYFFRALENVEPIKLPENIGVMDFTIVPYDDRNTSNPANPTFQWRIDDSTRPDAELDALIDEFFELNDTTAFSIVFSPAGKLVVHGVRVVNRDGFTDNNTNYNLGYWSEDDIFNKKEQVDRKSRGYGIDANPPGAGMFYQDDYFLNPYCRFPALDLGLGPEPSRTNFVIYNKSEFQSAYAVGRGWSQYLKKIADKIVYINPYTGRMIK